jgi:hypothetical protein
VKLPEVGDSRRVADGDANAFILEIADAGAVTWRRCEAAMTMQAWADDWAGPSSARRS